MIKAVIFDMDGVLIDTEKHLVRCWCQAAREAGFPFTRENGLELRSLAAKYADLCYRSGLEKNLIMRKSETAGRN